MNNWHAQPLSKRQNNEVLLKLNRKYVIAIILIPLILIMCIIVSELTNLFILPIDSPLIWLAMLFLYQVFSVCQQVFFLTFIPLLLLLLNILLVTLFFGDRDSSVELENSPGDSE